ncbi:MAG: hypothetical protein C5B43_00650 [Verrucomicrobia bacterium]|nr:MAG: hypothetical protein C5B43_00650 [Verrucomicrobiota bacterium]
MNDKCPLKTSGAVANDVLRCLHCYFCHENHLMWVNKKYFDEIQEKVGIYENELLNQLTIKIYHEKLEDKNET